METSPPITVVLADDQRAYREGLARAIAGHNRLELVAVARDGAEALAAIESMEPDVALVDVRMAALDGTTLCTELRRRYPALGTRVVLMSAQDAPVLSEHAERAGADGFVAKDRSRREICEALVRVSERGREAAVLAPAQTG